MEGIGRVESGTETEQLSRTTQDNSMDGIGRVASGTKTEQLSRSGSFRPTLRYNETT